MNHFAPYPELQQAAKQWDYQPNAEVLAGKNILVTGAGACVALTPVFLTSWSFHHEQEARSRRCHR